MTKAKRLLSRLSAKSNQTSKNKEGERERVTIKTMTDVSSLRSKGEEKLSRPIFRHQNLTNKSYLGSQI